MYLSRGSLEYVDQQNQIVFYLFLISCGGLSNRVLYFGCFGSGCAALYEKNQDANLGCIGFNPLVLLQSPGSLFLLPNQQVAYHPPF